MAKLTAASPLLAKRYCYMGEKPKVESDPEKGGFSPPVEKPRRDNVGPTPTDDPNSKVPKKSK